MAEGNQRGRVGAEIKATKKKKKARNVNLSWCEEMKKSDSETRKERK